MLSLEACKESSGSADFDSFRSAVPLADPMNAHDRFERRLATLETRDEARLGRLLGRYISWPFVHDIEGETP